MSITVFIAVLFAAVFHACWNALVKVGSDRFLGISLLTFFSGIVTLPALFWIGLPALSAWKWLILSVLFHIGYTFSLSRCYTLADFNQIYPISRGSAPLMTAILGFFLFNEILPITALIGILLIILGIILISRSRKIAEFNLHKDALFFALLTALFTASYTLSDGNGSRVDESPLAYILWLFFLNGLTMYCIAWLRYRQHLKIKIKHYWKPAFFGGVMQLVSYGIVIWAMSHASIVLVAALRETSVLFAMLLSVYLLKEPFNRKQLLACLVILVGIVAIKMG
ncbi:EamA family transporter [Proteus mirabilis]|uniref:EamA family transporter n=1 Tax=Proteus mirabilis TaxID=584 RepID=UPI0018C49A80|nr:EamA family transporter [Proteus mirabilis]MBG6017974.1 EamA family transporter [Proteus mirabilis]MDX4949510.1 DMT family transporter [Proteus mirabilis]